MPELRLLHTSVVSGSELAVVVERRDSRRKLGHRVKGLGERVNQLLDVVRQLSARDKILRQTLRFFNRRNLACQQEPKHRLRQHLLTRTTNVLCTWQFLLALGNALSVERNTALGVKHRAFPQHALEATHTTQQVAHRAITKLRLRVFGLQLSELLTLGRHCLAHSLSKRLRRRKSNC